jgi:hypothetical protein
VTTDLALQAFYYASLVAGYVLMSTGLATVRYGPEFLPSSLRQLQQRHGWPGRELAPRGPLRVVGFAFGVGLLALDTFVLAGVIVTAAAKSDPAVAVFVLEFALAVSWTVLLWRWIRRTQQSAALANRP